MTPSCSTVTIQNMTVAMTTESGFRSSVTPARRRRDAIAAITNDNTLLVLFLYVVTIGHMMELMRNVARIIVGA